MAMMRARPDACLSRAMTSRSVRAPRAAVRSTATANAGHFDIVGSPGRNSAGRVLDQLVERVGADHGVGAVGEVQDARAAVDEDDALRQHGVDGADPDSEQHGVRELVH